MPHYARVIAMVVLGLVAIGGMAWRLIKPKPAPLYEETAMLSPDIRGRLQALRVEAKFAPGGDYPGPKGPKTRARLSAVIDDLLDDILSEPDGPIEASDLAGRLGLAVAAVSKRTEADARRAHGYMLEIWWIFGFRSAAGYFKPEDGAGVVDGWAEPLPPGWTSPDGRPKPLQGAVNLQGAP
ncbi:hypothetical protein MMB232_03053 [Brevundimonas subvibrioides]|uniref:hypothetical protein n=1 Tax=Brevundimonas subvibrioides TaxID=74313 RepID=UPI0032D56D0D